MKVFGIIFLCFASVFSKPTETTVELLAADGRFNTLVSFVTKARLVDTLNQGTFTIFAPTDKAFSNLDSSITKVLGTDVNMLTDVLLYHVTSGKVPSSAVSNDLKIAMVNRKEARLNVYSHNNVITIDGSVISQVDLAATNGIIHVIDSVILAPTGSIVDYVAGNANLSTLLSLVQKAGLTDALKGDGLTLFAPTNDVFNRLTPSVIAGITNDIAKLSGVLKKHVSAGTKYSIGLWQREHIATLKPNTNLTIHFLHHHNDLRVQNAFVTTRDISTTNGVIHLIDHVLHLKSYPIVG